jgi:hypothetical protein
LIVQKRALTQPSPSRLHQKGPAEAGFSLEKHWYYKIIALLPSTASLTKQGLAGMDLAVL